MAGQIWQGARVEGQGSGDGVRHWWWGSGVATMEGWRDHNDGGWTVPQRFCQWWGQAVARHVCEVAARDGHEAVVTCKGMAG